MNQWRKIISTTYQNYPLALTLKCIDLYLMIFSPTECWCNGLLKCVPLTFYQFFFLGGGGGVQVHFKGSGSHLQSQNVRLDKNNVM